MNRYSFAIVVIMAMALFASGCGDSNPNATFDPLSPAGEGGGHPPGWLPEDHAVTALPDMNACTECHGVSFQGGISGVACTSCHLGSETEVHPLDWADMAYSRHEGYVDANGTASCAVRSCHGADLNGVAKSGPSCITECHLGGLDSAHPVDWDPFAYTRHKDFVEDNGTSSCENRACHGAGDAGTPPLMGVAESGPACSSCHLGDVFSGGQWTFSFHPAAWEADFELHGDYVSVNGTSSCRNDACHGQNLEGVISSGPACTVCHNPF